VVYTLLDTPERHTRVVYTVVHTWEAYPGIYTVVHTWEATLGGIYTTVHPWEATLSGIYTIIHTWEATLGGIIGRNTLDTPLREA